MSAPGLVSILSENWTLTPPRELSALVRMAVEAEEAGFDAVMLSEHVAWGAAPTSTASPRTRATTRCPATRVRTTRGRARWCC